jgi:macrodomain Ter protein organizer (MatP/YcbG family)
MDDADTIGLDYGVVRRVANKRIESLKDTIVHQVDNLEQLNYIRGQIKGLESLLQDLKDLQLKQERLNDGELNNFGRDPEG